MHHQTISYALLNKKLQRQTKKEFFFKYKNINALDKQNKKIESKL